MENNFLFNEPKTLPVILLLDTSGSMNENEKITCLNKAVNEMLQAFRDMDSVIATISVAIVTFGGKANVYNKLDLVENLDNVNFRASGMTPFGDGLRLTKQIIEQKENFPSRAYRPLVICLSDGYPTDNYEGALEEFINEGRSSKCQRMAMSIGADKHTPEYAILSKFAGGDENVCFSNNARDITKFFRFVTTTIQTRTESNNPNIDQNVSLNSLFEKDI